MPKKINNLAPYALILCPTFLAVAGALTREIIFLYAMIFVVVAIAGIVVGTNKIPKRLYPLAIFSIALGLLYQTTLMSPYLVGTDIHLEYYYYHLATPNGWDYTIPHNFNSSLAITVFAPFLAKVFYIDGVWVFKAVYPFLFAFVPVILYFAYRQLMEDKKAFMACFFFISVPVYFLEGIGIVKLQLASLFFAGLVFLAVDKRLSRIPKLTLAIICGLLLSCCYYTLGYIYMHYLGFGILAVLIVRLVKVQRVVSVRGMLVVALITLPLTFGYYSLVSGGNPAKTMVEHWQQRIIKEVILAVTPQLEPLPTEPTKPTEPAPTEPTKPTEPAPTEPTKPIEPTVSPQPIVSPKPSPSQLALVPGLKDNLIKAALGLDFNEASILGKAFRIFQFLTQIFILTGFGIMLWRRNRFPDSYVAFAGLSALVIVFAIVKPGLYSLFNITRLYYVTLFFLAPLCVIGGVAILKPILKDKALPVLTCAVLLPYFLFTAGFMFEVTKTPNIERMDVPYSIALSSHRVDICGVFTESDEDTVEWIISNAPKGVRVYMDIHGLMFTYEWLGSDKMMSHFPKEFSAIPDDAWIYLRQWNEENKTITYWNAIGLRKSFTYEEMGMEQLLANRRVIFNGGSACVYGGKQ